MLFFTIGDKSDIDETPVANSGYSTKVSLVSPQPLSLWQNKGKFYN